ncbi:tetratricopeptide repeat protein [Bremerella sp. T1]|uniref:tetratricopeptide repeat protein n=1 Tax=Bremerella sp. TYQ1 TaxID=3119568 RepID=UPI001CCA8ACC|nr:tetratricopeptide repeat protein [Bremerella volcania]UBM37773.1 tetratricopeptide repeat protein [Bremerella volcania]
MYTESLANLFRCLAILSLAFGFSRVGVAQDQSDTDGLQQLTAELREALSQDDSPQAVQVLDQLIKLQPQQPQLYYLRACENYKAENFRRSVDDFDQLIKLQPDRKDSLWERGISCYYAGDYADGAQQFLDYQNYHDQDVENSVWRYLCLAKSESLAKARETLIPIERDPRPGLQEVLELYRGNATPEKLLEQMEQSELTGQAQAGYRFYTLLYVGLYYVAEGQDKLASKYLAMAADRKLLEAGPSRISEYMWLTAGIAQRDVEKRLAKDAEKQK